MIDIAKGRYWDKAWSLGFSFSSFVSSFSVGIGNIVFLCVAVKAERFPVRYYISQLRKFREWLNVMRMKISAPIIATIKAGIIVALKYRLAPLTIIRTCSGYFNLRSHTTLPIRVVRPIKRPVSVLPFCFAKFAQLPFLCLGKRNSLAPFVVTATLCKSFSHGSCNIRWLSFLYPNAFMAFNTQVIITKGVFRKVRKWFPCFTFLATLFCFTENKIFIQRKADFSGPSSENTLSLVRHCFHDPYQYYMKGIEYVK